MKTINWFVFLICIVINFKLNAQIITTVAGGATGHGGYWGDGGAATAAELSTFGGLAIDRYGNIFIGDGNNQRIRKVDVATGIITTFAGNGIMGYNGDGIPATAAELNEPGAMAFDSPGNLYIGESGFRIRKVDLSGIISTYVGTGTMGFSGDGGPATSANIVGGAMGFDSSGNMYMDDGINWRTRKITAAGIIATIAGTGTAGSSGDGGQATAARIHTAEMICTDFLGNVYLTDANQSVRKIDVRTGIITRIIGTGDSVGVPHTGDGGPATSSHTNPNGVAVDGFGNIYVADDGNHRIEKVDTNGIIWTIAGTGINGFGGDGGPATAAKLSYPENVAVDLCGNVYIADFNNKRVRKITYPPNPFVSVSGVAYATVGDTITLTARVINAGYNYLIRWLNHGIPFATTTTSMVRYLKTMGTDSITAVVYGCNDSAVSGVHVVVNSKVSVAGPKSNITAGVKMYPNPVGKSLTIVAEIAMDQLEIVDIYGRGVLAACPKSKEAAVSVADLPPGLYLVKVNGLFAGRFVKE